MNEDERTKFFWSSWQSANSDKTKSALCSAYRNMVCDVMKARDPEIEEIGSSDINCVLHDMWRSISVINPTTKELKPLTDYNTWFEMYDYYFGEQGLYDKPEETS